MCKTIRSEFLITRSLSIIIIGIFKDSLLISITVQDIKLLIIFSPICIDNTLFEQKKLAHLKDNRLTCLTHACAYKVYYRYYAYILTLNIHNV